MTAGRMMMACGVAAALITAATAAEAAHVRATFTGKITAGFDAGGKVFGLSDLSGLDYTVSYLIDEDVFTSRSAAPSAPVPSSQAHYQIVGGYYATTPILEVSLTVNGVTQAFDYADYAAEYADGALEWMNLPATPRATLDVRGNLGRQVTYSGGLGRDYVNFVNQAGSTTPIPYTLADGWTPQTLLSMPTPVYFARAWGDARGGYDFFYQITSGTVTSARLQAGVPEPQTWGLMILGFGAAGAVLRRRRLASV